MTADSRLMTAEQLLQLPSGTWRYELVRGELRRMSPSGHVHGKVAAQVVARLAPFVEQHELGNSYAAETGFLLRRSPDTVRAPDFAFVSKSTLAHRVLSSDGCFPGPPDVAIEVVSPSDSYSEVDEKVAEWLAAGCAVVVVLDPRRTAGSVHRIGQPVVSVEAEDRLEIPDVLPGWSVDLKELFS